jgi:hypothetical protein
MRVGSHITRFPNPDMVGVPGRVLGEELTVDDDAPPASSMTPKPTIE